MHAVLYLLQVKVRRTLILGIDDTGRWNTILSEWAQIAAVMEDDDKADEHGVTSTVTVTIDSYGGNIHNRKRVQEVTPECISYGELGANHWWETRTYNNKAKDGSARAGLEIGEVMMHLQAIQAKLFVAEIITWEHTRSKCELRFWIELNCIFSEIQHTDGLLRRSLHMIVLKQLRLQRSSFVGHSM